MAAAGLSFLGMGPQPPSPEWGAMLSEGRNYLQVAWWIGILPGAGGHRDRGGADRRRPALAGPLRRAAALMAPAAHGRGPARRLRRPDRPGGRGARDQLHRRARRVRGDRRRVRLGQERHRPYPGRPRRPRRARSAPPGSTSTARTLRAHRPRDWRRVRGRPGRAASCRTRWSPSTRCAPSARRSPRRCATHGVGGRARPRPAGCIELLDRGRRARAGAARPAVPARALRRAAAAGADRLGDRRATRPCSSPTSRPPRSTSPSRRRSCGCSPSGRPRGRGLLLISHDLAVVARLADRVR